MTMADGDSMVGASTANSPRSVAFTVKLALLQRGRGEGGRRGGALRRRDQRGDRHREHGYEQDESG